MTSVPDVGSEQDMSQQQVLAQVDGGNLQNKILDAHNLIYKRNYAVNSPCIQKLLKDESLIPTMVSVDSTGIQGVHADTCRMPSQRNSACLVSVFLPCS